MNKSRSAVLWIFPSLFLLALVTIYPLAYVFWLSLQRRMLIFNISEFVGLANYRFLFEDSRFLLALNNTAYFVAVSVTLELVLGLAVAKLLDGAIRGRGLLRGIVLLPWVIPSVVSAKMWEWMFNADFGLLNYLLDTKLNWLGSPTLALHAAIAVDVWKTTPFVALLLLAALQGVPRELYQSAAIDGAGAWRIFRSVTLPTIRNAVVVVVLLRALDACRVFDVVYVLTGGGPAGTTETLSIYAYRLLFQTLQFGYGSAVAVSVFIFIAFLAFICASFLRRES